MRIFSTFTGIGGFEIGIQNAVEVTNKAKGYADTVRLQPDDTSDILQEGRLSASCVGYSEIDKYACSVFEKHNPGVHNYGDITKINEEELPDFDCLVGGFPCQAFSIAGKRGGFDDTRGTLFFDLARILRAKQPRYFVFENVKGLLSHDKGNTFRTIITTIDELGYDCQWSVLNSKNFGVPQNRERIIIVGHLRGTPRPQVFPITGTDSADTYIRTIRAGGAGSFTEKHARDIIKVREATKKGYAEATVGDAINLTAPNSQTRRGRVADISPTIDTGMQIHTADSEMRIRRLTPLECERLQAFPDDWTKYGATKNTQEGADGVRLETVSIITLSDTQRYKMCGNAVTTNVIQAVFERIFAND